MALPEAQHRDVGLVAVLLEEHPLQRPGPTQAVVRQVRRAFGQIEQDGVGLRQQGAVLQLQERNTPVGVFFEERFLAGLALDGVDFDQIVRNTQKMQ